jgi:hypothetical protein
MSSGSGMVLARQLRATYDTLPSMSLNAPSGRR